MEKQQNKNKKGNIRDYATIEQLIVLSNLENINAQMIHNNIEQQERLEELNRIARQQLTTLIDNTSIEKQLKSLR